MYLLVLTLYYGFIYYFVCNKEKTFYMNKQYSKFDILLPGEIELNAVGTPDIWYNKVQVLNNT